MVFGVLLLGWDPSAAGDVVGMLLLFPGMLILLAGCIAFCAKQDARQVLLVGAVTSGVPLPPLRSSFLLAIRIAVSPQTSSFTPRRYLGYNR
jgi:hypothetical protein